MAQIANDVTSQTNKNVVPMGGGGLPGHLLRMIVMICTGGFAFPNTFVEGMDLTAIQSAHLQPSEKK